MNNKDIEAIEKKYGEKSQELNLVSQTHKLENTSNLVLDRPPKKIKKLDDYKQKFVFPIKFKSNKSLIITLAIIVILQFSILLFLVESGKFISTENITMNANPNITNNYDFDAKVETPISNDFENNFNFEFDFSEELINKICNNTD